MAEDWAVEVSVEVEAVEKEEGWAERVDSASRRR